MGDFVKKYFVIGEHLPHTASPFIHKQLMQLAGIDGEYGVLEIEQGKLADSLDELRSADGFNVTIPYKKDIIPYLNSVSERAQLYSSVNTVQTSDDGMHGYNTDCMGFLGALDLMGVSLAGKVLLLGNGGVASMAACECAMKDVNLTIAGRNISKCDALKNFVKIKFPDSDITTVNLNDIKGDYDLLVNCTPCGMYPNVIDCPVSESVVKNCNAVYDMIYNPQHTVLLKTAKKYGIKLDCGISMLVIQAARAQEIWNDVKFSDAQLLSVIQKTSEYVKDNF